MTKKIHNAILLASLITFLCCILIILGISYPYFNEELRNEIISEADYLCAGTEIGGKEYLERFEEEHRITLIDTDGSVIYDTVSETYRLENHLDREEVKEAFETGEGESYRYSVTLTEKTYYYARRLSNGTVLRVSDDQITVGAILFRMLIPMTAALLVVITICATLSHSLAKKIIKPINELDFKNPDIKESYSEIAPLLNKISRQNNLIDLQMEDLKRRQEEFRTITHYMSEGLILIDDKAEVLSHNKSATILFSVEKTDLGDSVFTFNKSPEFYSAVNTALNGERCRPLMEVGGKTLQIYANPVKVEDRVSGAVLIILDVTEREQRDTMRREFTSNVSHELKTPLTSIYGISDMMINGLVKVEDMTKFAENIHDESGRLITLVNDIIKLSRLDEGPSEMEREDVDLYDYAKQILDRLNIVALEKNITLKLTGKHLVITAIPSVINEMIYNLCDNAIKYNKNNGSVTVDVHEYKGRPCITVKDTGIGISKEHKDRVFERFYRVDKSHSRQIGGTGLGLSIVKHGAAIHDAKIMLESTPNVGTEISVIF